MMYRSNFFIWVIGALCLLLSGMASAQSEDGGLGNVAGNNVTVSEMQSDKGAATLLTTKGGGGIPAFSVSVNPDGTEDYSVTLQILALMTALGFLPAIVILMTSFTRIVVVMSICAGARSAADPVKPGDYRDCPVHDFLCHVSGFG